MARQRIAALESRLQNPQDLTTPLVGERARQPQGEAGVGVSPGRGAIRNPLLRRGRHALHIIGSNLDKTKVGLAEIRRIVQPSGVVEEVGAR